MLRPGAHQYWTHLKQHTVKEGGEGSPDKLLSLMPFVSVKRVRVRDLCRLRPSSIIFTHYARADKIQGDTCRLGGAIKQ